VAGLRSRGRLQALILCVSLLPALAPAVDRLGAQTRNGFDLSGALVPASEILSGGPPRDGIPALSRPAFDSAEQAADWLRRDDRVLGIALGGAAKAYPVRILNWHEVVNDQVSGEPVLISFCPLCGTGMAFDGRANGRTLTFGVSGLLYNSDVLMYDRETESLWTQIGTRAVTGSMKGTELRQLPLLHTTWSHWRELHPETLVLSRRTGYDRDYEADPYLGYGRDPRLMFPVSRRDDRLGTKELVLGIVRGGEAKAFSFGALGEEPSPVRVPVGGEDLFVYFDRDSQTAFATDLRGRPVPATVAYWFAWSAFHPETGLWEGGGARTLSRRPEDGS
jgi:hypothetical protein